MRRRRTNRTRTRRLSLPPLQLVRGGLSAPVSETPRPQVQIVHTAPTARVKTETPLLPPWTVHPVANLKWSTKHLGVQTLRHVLWSPTYLRRLLTASPKGFGKAVVALYCWVTDYETKAIRKHTLDNLMVEHFLYVDQPRRFRIQWRFGLFFLGILGLVSLGWLISTSPAYIFFSVLAVIVAFGVLGRQNFTREVQTQQVAPTDHQRLTEGRLQEAFVHAGLAKEDKPIGFIAPGVFRDGEGWSATVKLPYNVSTATASEAMKKMEVLAAGLDISKARLFLSPQQGANASERNITMWVADKDPYAGDSAVTPLAKMNKLNFWEGIPYGIDARHNPIKLHLLWSHMLIGASPRRGKTWAAQAIAAGAALDPDVKLVIIDGKGGADWNEFRDVAERFHKGMYPAEVVDILATMQELVHDMDRRYQIMGGLPRSLVPESKITEELSRDPNYDFSIRLVVLDEAQNYTSDPVIGKKIKPMLDRLVKSGSALGIIVLMITQRPDADTIPEGIRAQLGTRFALQVANWNASDIVLGSGSYPTFDASKILDHHLGVGWLKGSDDNPNANVRAKLIRTYALNGLTLEKIIEKAKALRSHRPISEEDRYDLLFAVRDVFGENNKLPTHEILSRLQGADPRWAYLTTATFNKAMKGYGINDKSIRKGAKVDKGYDRDHLEAHPQLQTQNSRSEA